jgi:hypothetical protein
MCCRLIPRPTTEYPGGVACHVWGIYFVAINTLFSGRVSFIQRYALLR